MSWGEAGGRASIIWSIKCLPKSGGAVRVPLLGTQSFSFTLLYGLRLVTYTLLPSSVGSLAGSSGSSSWTAAPSHPQSDRTEELGVCAPLGLHLPPETVGTCPSSAPTSVPWDVLAQLLGVAVGIKKGILASAQVPERCPHSNSQSLRISYFMSRG